MRNKLDTKFSSAKASPGFLFWKVANLHQRVQRNALKHLAISPTQFSILACYFFLKSDKDLPTQSDICQMAGLDKMLVSDTTKALLKKKLITRKIKKSDLRSFEIELTTEGKSICNKAVKIIEAVDDQFFELSGNMKQLMMMLQQIEKNSNSITFE